MSTRIEQRIHAAVKANKGIFLSADEVWGLAVADDAMATRIANAAATDAGNDEPGEQVVVMWSMTWKELGEMCGDRK